MQQILTYAFLVIYTVTILGIVLVIITDNRNPLKTLPWIIVLVFAPVVGLVFYFFFGQNLSKQRIISRRTRKRITMQLEEALDDGRPDIPDEHLPLARLLAATIHSVPLYGSRITPYTDGKSKMEALLAEIARAKHHIHIQYYILLRNHRCSHYTKCKKYYNHQCILDIHLHMMYNNYHYKNYILCIQNNKHHSIIQHMIHDIQNQNLSDL